VLNVLRVCVDRAYTHKKPGGPFGENDEFAWRAIVCAEAAGYNQSIRELYGALSEP
jgi:hypothetical protein